MNKSNALFPTLFALSLLAFTQPAHAIDTEADEDLMDYSSIVRELSGEDKQNVSKAKLEPARDPFDDILLHGGIGLASTFGRVAYAGKSINLNQRGFQAALGIDLFSDHWLAEGTVRSFGDTDYDRTSVSMQEFDLKFYYHDKVAPRLGIRVGAGLSARYMTIQEFGRAEDKYTTPATVAALGIEYLLNQTVSFGAEMSSRNSLIDETIDRNSVDGVIRIDTHF